MCDDNPTTEPIGGDGWKRAMVDGIKTKEDAVTLLMALSILAESIALTISVEHTLRAKEQIERRAAVCKHCFGICLCGVEQDEK